MYKRFLTACIVCLLAAPLTGRAQSDLSAISGRCSRIGQMHLSHAKVTESIIVESGAFVPPGKLDPNQQVLYKALPSFCRAIVHAKPSADSDIAIEIWMPAAGWNGKFKATGNGGFAGYVGYSALATALSQGYATAGTDTGHTGKGNPALDSEWALHHPERVADFGYRAIHLMTVNAKTLIHSFYGQPAAHSYFASCSNGGRQGLMEAQRFPEDYDGILAGSPAYDWTSLNSGGLKLLQEFDGPGYIPAAKVPTIANAVVAQCDALDGVRDGIISDPPRCRFDPSALLCKSADTSRCLNAPQIASLTFIYGGIHSPGPHIPGFPPGGEDGPGGWKAWITGKEQGKSADSIFTQGTFRDMVYDDPAWSYEGKNMDAAYEDANEKIGGALNAVDPSLKRFAARGGKLILYHGWSDAAIPAEMSSNYYKSVRVALGPEKTERFVRLYLVPGMQHCEGGPGPNAFGQSDESSRKDARHDIYTALEHWVETGAAPSEILATKYLGDDRTKGAEMTRPLCPYPQVQKYNGTGNPNDAQSFQCASDSIP